MAFPQTRLRRLRKTGVLRDLVRETDLRPRDFVYPLFVTHGADVREPVDAMPGVDRLSINRAVEEAGSAAELGIPAVLLFGIPAAKDEQGSEAYDDEGIVQLAVRAIKEALPELLVITDVCLCEYTSHGHCGVVRADGHVDNDLSLELITRTAVSHAVAGADVVAPSDMMDGRIGAVRSQLDEAGFSETPIIAYSAKFASAFYGPFREAAGATPQFGDRRGYQMDPGNAEEAVREARLDMEEGADVVMVKPALPYLDVIRRVKDETRMPVAAYNVSGEYAMIKAAAAAGFLDERAVVLEALTAIRRAGGRHRHHLPRQGCRPMADVTATPKLRSRKHGAAVPLDDLDRRLLNLMQGSFPLEPRPYARVAGLAEVSEEEVLARVQRLLDERIIRQVTPIFDTRALGYSSMLVAAKVRPRAPAAGREGDQRASRRLAQLPAKPRVQPLVHDRDGAGLGAGPRGHA